jgi:pimeloyl-ACP methyl ester carboxylesterase
MTYTVSPVPDTRTITTSDGRELAYLEFGEADAPLVIHNHGGPSSRIEGCLLADAAARNGLRLVSVDRPGFGRSSPPRDRTFTAWAEDLTAVADALGHREFGVSGWSEGGPAALAAAAYIDPSRLRHVTYVAGAAYGAFGDDSAAPYLDRADALGGQLALHHRMAFHLMYALIELGAVHFRTSYITTLTKTLNARDAELLRDPAVADAFADAAAECFRQGSEALTEDAELAYRAWPFDVTHIERPVHVWQGTDDHLVPHRINEEVAERMPGAIWHPVEGEDHLVALSRGDTIFATAARELGPRGGRAGVRRPFAGRGLLRVPPRIGQRRTR